MPCCDNVCHAVKGTGYFFGASTSSLLIVATAVVVMGIAIALLAADGYMFYEVVAANPLHLFWVIPVAFCVILTQIGFMKTIRNIGKAVAKVLGRATKYYGDKSIEHFKLTIRS